MSKVRPLALILDDSPVLLLQLQRQLVALGLLVKTVPDEAQLLRQVEAAAVVFIELQLMHGNGFQVTRRLGRQSTCPLILLTGTGRHTDLQWGLRAGAAAVLARPLQPEQLRNCLQTLGLAALAA